MLHTAQGTFHQWLLELTPEDITRAIAASRGGTGVWRQIWDSITPGEAATGRATRTQAHTLNPNQNPVSGSLISSAASQGVARAGVPTGVVGAMGGEVGASSAARLSLKLPEVDPLVSAYGALCESWCACTGPLLRAWGVACLRG